MWSKEFFKDDIVKEFEQYFKKLDKSDSERAGCQTRWTKDYFQNLPDEVQECFEEQALAEKDQLKGEGLTRSVEDLATKVGGDENSNEGGDEIVSAGKGKNLAVKSESSVVSGGGGTVSGV